MSAPLLRALLESEHELVLVVSDAGHLRDASEGFARLLGRDRSELRGLSVRELVHPEHPPAEDALRLLDEGGRVELAFGATPTWLELRVVDPGADRVVFARGVTRAASSDEPVFPIDALARQLPGLFWTTDLDGRITSITGSGLASKNRPAEELIGRMVTDFVGSDDPELPPDPAHQKALSGTSAQYEFERVGHRFCARVEPLLASDGSVVGTIGLAVEIADSGGLQQRLRAAQREQTLGRVAGAMAHEFNNLLTVIAAHSALLEDQLAHEAAQDDLAAVRAATREGRILTSRLLSFTSRQIQSPERIRVKQLVAELEPMLRALLGESRRLSLVVDPGVGWVKCDPALMEQVIIALVDNARQATEEGGRVAVHAAARMDDVSGRGWVEIFVRDDGVGMNERVRDRACEPFFTTHGEGLGLGLATAAATIRDARGVLEVESELGVGTTVRIALPRVAPKSGLFTSPVRTDPSETVLLVEDQLGVRRAARRVLRRAGYQVFEAAHGQDALALATTFPGRIDVLLTDVMMPGMNGPQLARTLLLQRPDLRVLYMSGYAEDVDEVRAALERGDVFLPKPFTPERLLDRVRLALGEGIDPQDVEVSAK